MIMKTNKYYWMVYSLCSRMCKKTGMEINPFTGEILMEIEI